MKKIVFSRKGFDTHNGGFPSPVFPDGTLYSVPIPGKYNKKRYCDLEFVYGKDRIQDILNDLTKKRIKIKGESKKCNYNDAKFRCHEDPVVIDGKMTLGQVGSALGHLRKQNVQKGDIFLFYGLFQKVERKEGKWKYIGKPFHMIFGYMKIEEVFNVNEGEDDNLRVHPHFDDEFMKKYNKDNMIFTGREYKIFNFDDKRVLSALKSNKGHSYWCIPVDVDFSLAFSHIKKMEVKGSEVYFRSPSPGQEFVLNLDAIPQKEKIIRYIDTTLS